MITYRLLVSSPFLIISGERACEWAVLMREFSRLPQMESLLARGVLKTRGRGRGRGCGVRGSGVRGGGPGGGAGGAGGRGAGGRGAGARCGVYLFFRVRISVKPTLTLKQRSLKRRDLDSGPGPDTFRSDLEVYYWVVRKGQTQDELRL